MMYCLLAVLILLGKDNEIFLSIPLLWPNIRLKWFVAAIYLHDTALCWAVAGFQETIIPRHVKWTWSWKLVIFLSEIKSYIIIVRKMTDWFYCRDHRRGGAGGRWAETPWECGDGGEPGVREGVPAETQGHLRHLRLQGGRLHPGSQVQPSSCLT